MNAQLKKKAQEALQVALKLENDSRWKLDSKEPNPIYTFEIGETLVVKGVSEVPYPADQVAKFVNSVEGIKAYESGLETIKILQ